MGYDDFMLPIDFYDFYYYLIYVVSQREKDLVGRNTEICGFSFFTHTRKVTVMYKKISDLKKGDRVLLNYGEQNGDIATCGTFNRWTSLLLTSSFKAWEGVVMEKPRGKNPTTIFLEVHGWEKDLGSVYAHQVIGWYDENSGFFEPIEHTTKQKECETQVEELLHEKTT
jgi:hypothetical protein